MKRNAKSAPTMTPELHKRMLKAIAEEEQPKVIAATKKQARAALKKPIEVAGPVSTLLESIRQERERQNLSLADLSARTGIDRGNLSRTLRGEQSAATIERLSRIAAAVGGTLSLQLVMK